MSAGADVLWFEMRNAMLDIEAMARQFKGRIPLHFNHSSSGKVPRLSLEEIEKLGFKTVGYHAHAANAAAASWKAVAPNPPRTGQVYLLATPPIIACNCTHRAKLFTL